MHILFLAPNDLVHSQRFLQLLLDKGHTVSVLGSCNPRPDGAVGYRFIPFSRPKSLARWAEFAERIHWRLATLYYRRLEPWVRVAWMKQICSQIKPDVINVHYVDERAWYCARAGFRPLVLSCWGSDINDIFDSEYTEVYRKRVISALAAADCITADSQEVIGRCEDLTGKKLPTCFFHFGIDPERFKPGYAREAGELRQGLGIAPTNKVILSARRVDPRCGQLYILQAFADIARCHTTSDVVLVFRRYYAHKETERKLRSEAARLGVEGRVYWLEEAPHDELPIQYAMADVVVNYSERDAFPVSLFESAACKCPVVCSDLPAYQGVFGDSFLMVPPRDPRALADALRRALFEGLGETRSRVERAYRISLEVGDQSKNVGRMIHVFETTLAQHRNGERWQRSFSHAAL